MDKKDRNQNTGHDAGQSSPRQHEQDTRKPEQDTRKTDERVKGSGSSNEPGKTTTQRQPGRLPLPD